MEVVTIKAMNKDWILREGLILKNADMNFTFNKEVNLNFSQAIGRIKEELQKEGFGVITEVDLKTKFKEKLGLDFRNYTILGACNPALAYKAIEQEENIGVLLPCNILVQEHQDGRVEIAAINPMESIGAVGKDALIPLAAKVSQNLKSVIERV